MTPIVPYRAMLRTVGSVLANASDGSAQQKADAVLWCLGYLAEVSPDAKKIVRRLRMPQEVGA